MKKTILLAALGLISLSALAQDKPQEEGFVFTTVKENPITSIKNQNRSSTCWSFSSLGFLESELLRTGKGEYDLSEMFVVHHTMVDRAVNNGSPRNKLCTLSWRQFFLSGRKFL